MATQVRTEAAWIPQRTGGSTEQGVFGIPEDRVARGLGWFSVGLGLAELIAPRAIARVVGSRNHKSMIRFYGIRELAAGIGILASERPAGWMWARVAGDAVDLASLAGIAGAARNGKGRAALAIASVAGVTALDIACAKRLSQEGQAGRAEANMIVDRSPEECYQFWRNFQNLPRFMSYVESVAAKDGRESHWVARGPMGQRVEWDSEIVNDVPNQRISWRSQEGSDVWHSGSVDFEAAPGNRGTIVRVQMDYRPQLGALAPLASLMGREPEQMIRKELRRFKQVMETGEVITTEGQPAGRPQSVTLLDRAAR